jgi:exonuclease SbcD
VDGGAARPCVRGGIPSSIPRREAPVARLLHTSDWHLGRQIYRRGREDEFDAVIAEIVQIAREARPDVIIHSGDLFDTPVPSFETFRRGLRALRQLQQTAPVLVVAGNHDGRNVLRVLDEIENGSGTDDAAPGRLRFVTEAARSAIYAYPVGDGGDDRSIRVAALPFIHQNRFRYEFDDPEQANADYARRIRQVQQDQYTDLRRGYREDRDVLVFAAHLFVEGAQPSYSERSIDIGADYASAVDALPAVAYGALGHIHKPQQVKRAGFPAYYAGSPMQLDFGESGETKTVVIVDASPGKRTRVEPVPLTCGRRLVRVEGTLEEISARYRGVGDAYVKAVVRTEVPTSRLDEALAKIFPQAVLVDIDERCAAVAVPVLDRATTADELPGTEELFRGYLGSAGVAGVDLDRVMASLAGLMAEQDPAHPGPSSEERLLAAAIAGTDISTVDASDLLVDCCDAAGAGSGSDAGEPRR